MTTTTDAPGEPPAAPLPVAFRPGSPADRKSRFWRTVWRVHFYAGIFVIPFLVMLAVTGTLVLYEDPINDVTDHDLTYVEPQAGDPLPLDEQVARVEQAFPDFEVGGVTPPTDDGYSTMVALAVNEADVRNVYVNPYTGDLLGSKIYRDDVPGLARLIHGTILFDWKLSVPTMAGIVGDEPLTTPVDVGDLLIELMSCWAIVLVVSGLYLWWPRKREAGKALFKPRLHKKGRARWRDLHAVPGAALSVVVLFLILTGLPWSGFWGGNWNHIANELDANLRAPEATASTLAETGDVDRFGNPIPWASAEKAIPESSGGGDHHEGSSSSSSSSSSGSEPVRRSATGPARPPSRHGSTSTRWRPPPARRAWCRASAWPTPSTRRARTAR